MKLDNTQRAGGLVIEDAVRYRLRLPGAGPSRLLAPATACAYLGIWKRRRYSSNRRRRRKKRPFHFDSAIDSIEWRNPFLVRPGPSASSLSLASDTFRNQKGLLNSGEPHAVCSWWRSCEKELPQSEAFSRLFSSSATTMNRKVGRQMFLSPLCFLTLFFLSNKARPKRPNHL